MRRRQRPSQAQRIFAATAGVERAMWPLMLALLGIAAFLFPFFAVDRSMCGCIKLPPLPNATHADRFSDGPLITVTASEVLMDSQRMGVVREGVLDARGRDTFHSHLAEYARNWRFSFPRASLRPVIACDRSVAFQTLQDVMKIIDEEGMPDVQFAVQLPMDPYGHL